MRTLRVLFTIVALGVGASLNPVHAEVLKVAGPWELTGIDPAQTGLSSADCKSPKL
jgi:peptide/nickel transport system substrate-binding protein